MSNHVQAGYLSVDITKYIRNSLIKFRFGTSVHFVLRQQKRDGLLGTGTGGGRGRKSEGSTADTAWKRPERPWTATRTMEVLRRCPLAIAQRLMHCAIAVSTAVLGQNHKDNVRCTAVEEQLEVKEVQLSQPSSTSLPMVSWPFWPHLEPSCCYKSHSSSFLAIQNTCLHRPIPNKFYSQPCSFRLVTINCHYQELCHIPVLSLQQREIAIKWMLTRL